MQCGKQFRNLITGDNVTFSSLICLHLKGFKSVLALNYHSQQVHPVANKDDCSESLKRAPAVLQGNASVRLFFEMLNGVNQHYLNYTVSLGWSAEKKAVSDNTPSPPTFRCQVRTDSHLRTSIPK